jgi:ABC-type nitrate/sulfonate/bicarbonate transport system substrate-binding protein
VKLRTIQAVAGILAGGILAAGCASSPSTSANPSGPSAPVVVKIGCTPSMGLVPQAYMMQSGLDQKYGIKLQCVNVTTGPQQAALLVSGGEDITNLLPANLYSLLDAGVPMVAFLPIQNGTSFDILVRKGFPLPGKATGWQGVMRDLSKARIGVPALGAAAEDLAQGLFLDAGLSAHTATYIATGTPATTLAALSNGSVDAAITFEPGISEALTQGVAVQPFSLIAGTGPSAMSGWGGAYYTATRQYATAHAAVLRDFTKAYQAAVAWMTNSANHGKVVQFVESYMSVPAVVAQSMVTRNLPTFSRATTVEASRYDAQGAFFHRLGATKKAWSVSDYAFNVSQ